MALRHRQRGWAGLDRHPAGARHRRPARADGAEAVRPRWTSPAKAQLPTRAGASEAAQAATVTPRNALERARGVEDMVKQGASEQQKNDRRCDFEVARVVNRSAACSHRDERAARCRCSALSASDHRPRGLAVPRIALVVARRAVVRVVVAARALAWLVFVFILQFFRDPPRDVPGEPNAVLSPADGRIVRIGKARDPYLERDALKISVFMNVFNVHSNRSPVDGTVEDAWYHAGQVRQRRARQGVRRQRAQRAEAA